MNSILPRSVNASEVVVNTAGHTHAFSVIALEGMGKFGGASGSRRRACRETIREVFSNKRLKLLSCCWVNFPFKFRGPK